MPPLANTYHVQQFDDVRVVQVLQKSDFAESGLRDPFLGALRPQLLDGHQRVVMSVARLYDFPVRPLADGFDSFVEVVHHDYNYRVKDINIHILGRLRDRISQILWASLILQYN